MLFDSKWTNKVKMSYLYASKFVFKDSICPHDPEDVR